jgi:hypothetical protein
MILAKVSRVISAPVAEVWAVTSSFGAIRAWMPSVTKVSQQGFGLGAMRTVSSRFGLAQEKLEEIDPLRFRLRYSITSIDREQIKGLMGGTTLTALGDETKTTWLVEAAQFDGDPAFVAGAFEGFIIEGLNGLAKFLGAGIR